MTDKNSCSKDTINESIRLTRANACNRRLVWTNKQSPKGESPIIKQYFNLWLVNLNKGKLECFVKLNWKLFQGRTCSRPGFQKCTWPFRIWSVKFFQAYSWLPFWLLSCWPCSVCSPCLLWMFFYYGASFFVRLDIPRWCRHGFGCQTLFQSQFNDSFHPCCSADLEFWSEH